MGRVRRILSSEPGDLSPDDRLALIVVGEVASVLAGGVLAALALTDAGNLPRWIGWLGLFAALCGAFMLARIAWLRRN